MVRSILVGLLVISGASACGGGRSDAPEVQPGVLVGKVVEISGKVTAARGTATRDLDASSQVSGDDVITTAEGARVVILLAHNNATWDLGPNKHEQVSQSMAWKLAKVDAPAGQVDETTTAAGRHAERSAANGESAAAERSRAVPAAAPPSESPTAPPSPQPVAAVAPPPPPPRPPPAAAPSQPPGASGGKGAPAPNVVRSNVAPPRTAITADRRGSIDELGVTGGSGPSTGTRRAPIDKAEGKAQDKVEGKAQDKAEGKAEDKAQDKAQDKVDEKADEKADAKADAKAMHVEGGLGLVKSAVERERAALRTCVVASGKDKLAIVFHVDKGKTSIDLADGTDADRACLAKVAARIRLTVDAPTTYATVIAK